MIDILYNLFSVLFAMKRRQFHEMIIIWLKNLSKYLSKFSHLVTRFFQTSKFGQNHIKSIFLIWSNLAIYSTLFTMHIYCYSVKIKMMQNKVKFGIPKKLLFWLLSDHFLNFCYKNCFFFVKKAGSSIEPSKVPVFTVQENRPKNREKLS